MPGITTAFAQGTHAARPSAASSNNGYMYWETDTYTLFQSTGSAWQQVSWTMTPPAVRCYNSSNQSITSGTWTTLAFNSNRFDQGTATAQHSTSSNSSRLTCQVAGVYQITAEANIDTSPSGARGLRLLLNGATVIADVYDDGLATGYHYRQATTLYSLSVADYVEAQAYQASGTSVNVLASGNESPEFMWARVG